MKTFKKFITLLLIGSFANLNLYMAQSDLDAMAYQAYLSGNTGLWKQLVEKHYKIYEAGPSNKNLYQLVIAQHGLLNATMPDKDEELFNKYYEQTKDNLDKLIEDTYETGNAKALLSSIYGLEMAYISWKGIYLGPKSSSNLEEAIKLAPSSPLVWQIYGSSKFFTPSMFGGDKKEAVHAYEKSVQLYEADPGLTKSNWRYLDALAWLGQSYQQTGEIQKAKKTLEKALSVEPEFGWVKYVLLPKGNAR